MRLTVRLNLSGLAASYEAMAARAEDLTKPLAVGKVRAESEVRLRFQTSTGPRGQPWAPLKRPRIVAGASGSPGRPLLDTGALRASITGRSDARSITIGTALRYARLQQLGGEVRPVRAKALAIPLTREAKRAGSPRRFPEPLRVVRLPGVGAVLVDKAGVPQYRLVRRVVVPERPFLGFSDKWVGWFGALLGNYVTTGRLTAA